MGEAVEAWRAGIGILRPSQARIERLGEWYVAEHARLVRFAYVLTRDTQAAQDLVQEAFVRMYRAGARAEERGLPSYARRTIINLTRSARRRRAIEQRALAGLGTGPDAHDPDHAAGIDVRRALLSLAVTDRACLALRYYEGLTDREIATTLGIGDAAAAKRVERAHARLRALLSEEES